MINYTITLLSITIIPIY